MKERIAVVTKMPQAKPVIRVIENELYAFQKFVRGYIQAVPASNGKVVICNEEGRINGMEYNCTFEGIDYYGPILVCGADGENFADCPKEFREEIRRHNA